MGDKWGSIQGPISKEEKTKPDDGMVSYHAEVRAARTIPAATARQAPLVKQDDLQPFADSKFIKVRAAECESLQKTAVPVQKNGQLNQASGMVPELEIQTDPEPPIPGNDAETPAILRP